MTALSSNHFQENLDLLENINTVVRPVMGNIKVLVYDLGINSTERDKVRRFKGALDFDLHSVRSGRRLNISSVINFF